MTDAESRSCLSEEFNRLKREVEEKNRLIEELKVSNLFLGTLFDGIGEEIMVVDPECNIMDANSTFLDKYRLEKKKVLGRKCFEVKQRTDSPCYLKDSACPLERARLSGETVEMTRTFENSRGETSEHILMMYPLRSRGGEIDCFLEIARDVTEYRKLIKRLKSSEKRFRAILDTATDAILSIDDNHRIILFNNAARKIFGYTRREILGQNLDVLIPLQYGDHYGYVQKFLSKRVAGVLGRTVSLTALRKGGEEFPVELSLSFMDMGGVITFTAIVRDVSGQKQLEKKLLQSERLAAVGHSVAYVAHEIKNPLMIIGGFSHQIKRALTGKKDLKRIDMILDEVNRLERLVAEIGDFTREYRLVKRKSDIHSVIQDVMRVMTGVYSSGLYAFETHLADDLNEIICDPDKLKQVFINIISNGFEAMPEGGAIAVSTSKISTGIEIRISDSGTGIPEEELQHIFEPFYTTRERGCGLGLAISFKIIEAHHGEISALSSPGKGTTFIITLPS